MVATGVTPRTPTIPGIEHEQCASYVEILDGSKTAGARVAILGAGGIGFDIAEFLTSAPQAVAAEAAHFAAEWGVDASIASRGGLAKGSRVPSPLAWGRDREGGIAEPLPSGFPPPLTPPHKG